MNKQEFNKGDLVSIVGVKRGIYVGDWEKKIYGVFVEYHGFASGNVPEKCKVMWQGETMACDEYVDYLTLEAKAK